MAIAANDALSAVIRRYRCFAVRRARLLRLDSRDARDRRETGEGALQPTEIAETAAPMQNRAESVFEVGAVQTRALRDRMDPFAAQSDLWPSNRVPTAVLRADPTESATDLRGDGR